ncbi:MAG: HlyD family efflux transporter periplasmic adaptor subunit [Cyclobacteriaceae bacterium]|nr:HlyD family efflux transporter periplasmic adaptor subunit [Cyclobacteriaceae bacterium]
MLKISKESIDDRLPKDRLYSLRTLQTPRAGRVLARWLFALGLIFFVLLFLPWQQNIRGRGEVTALNPAHRPQTVQTAIAGRIQQWRVREGQLVSKGDTILSLAEIKEKYFDPQLLLRLSQQIDAKEKSIQSKDQKANSLKDQISALRLQQKVKYEQAQAKLEAQRVRFQNAENQFQRNKSLFEAGNIPLTKFQDFEYKYQGSKADYNNAEIELDQVNAEYLDKINKAESELNNTLAELFDSQGSLAKLKNEYANMSIRNEQYQVIAPQDGIVVRALKAGIGETIKEGEAVCTIMPESSDLAVAMYVKAMDVPLISKGRRVRIQFDGWPALQFSGWPSVSVGTFGGVVEVIDYVNSKPGEFRILVTPDQTDEKWPPQLRMGSGTKGWVMLNDVPVWFEIWRQLNGFPASVYQAPEEPVADKKGSSAGEEDEK